MSESLEADEICRSCESRQWRYPIRMLCEICYQVWNSADHAAMGKGGKLILLSALKAGGVSWGDMTELWREA